MAEYQRTPTDIPRRERVSQRLDRTSTHRRSRPGKELDCAHTEFRAAVSYLDRDFSTRSTTASSPGGSEPSWARTAARTAWRRSAADLPRATGPTADGPAEAEVVVEEPNVTPSTPSRSIETPRSAARCAASLVTTSRAFTRIAWPDTAESSPYSKSVGSMRMRAPLSRARSQWTRTSYAHRHRVGDRAGAGRMAITAHIADDHGPGAELELSTDPYPFDEPKGRTEPSDRPTHVGIDQDGDDCLPPG